MSRSSSSTEIGKFIFKGIRNDFQKFLDAIASEIQRNEYSEYIDDYLNITNFLLPDGSQGPLPSIYIKLPLPPAPVAAAATQGAMMAYAMEVQVAENHNKKRNTIISKGNEAILNHIDESIALGFKHIKDPREIMKYLHTRFGATVRTNVDIEVAFWEFMSIKMEDDEMFETFYVSRFQRAKDLCGVSDAIAFTVLKSMKDANPHGTQCIADRLTEELEICVREAKDLADFRNRMNDCDQRQLAVKGEKVLKKKKAHVLKKGDTITGSNNATRCRNCYNYGHSSEDCFLRACSLCREFQNDHQFHNCPSRKSKKSGNGNNNKGNKRPRRDQDSDDDSTSSRSSRNSRNSSRGNNNRKGDSPKKGKSQSSGNNGDSKGKHNKGNDRRANTPRKRSQNEEIDSNDEEIDSDISYATSSDDESDYGDDANEKTIVRFRENLIEESDQVDTLEGTPIPRLYAKGARLFHFPREIKQVVFASSSDDTTVISESESETDSDVDICTIKRQSNTSNRSKREGFHTVRKITVGKTYSNRKFSNTEMTFDTGAEANIAKDVSVLQHVNDIRKADLPIVCAANGTEMKVTAIGNINDNITDVHICPDVVESLLSGIEMQRSGHYIILPPTNYYKNDIGGVICDSEGYVKLRIRKDMTVDVSEYGNSNCDPITLPILPDNIRVRKIYGTAIDTSIKELVRITHEIGHFSKKQMKFQASAIANYPVTEAQIEDYFDYSCPVCVMGKMRKRTIKTFNQTKTNIRIEDISDGEILGTDKKKKSSSLPTMEQLIPLKMLEPRNLEIGSQIGIDYLGPILSLSTLNFTDKASGYTVSTIMRKDGKKDVEASFQSTLDLYAKYGHHSVEWNKVIKEFRMDSDPTFISQKIKKLCERNGIHAEYSPPHQHQLNGLAESKNQVIANMVTCMFAGAPYVPEQLWGVAWVYATMVSNLQSCNIPNSTVTRVEAFTGIRPDFNLTTFLPFGTVVQYHLSKEQRGKFKFSSKAGIGIYLMPSTRVAGAISVYSFATKRIVDRRTYKIVSHVPPAWTTISPKYFVFEGSTDEMQDLIDADIKEENLDLIQGAEPSVNKSSTKSTSITTIPSTTQLSAQPTPIPTLVPTVANPSRIEENAMLGNVDVDPVPQQTQVNVVAQSSSQEGEVVDSSTINKVSEPNSFAIKKRRRERKKKMFVKRVFSPVIESMYLCEDVELRNQLMKNKDSIPFTMLKTAGKRIKLVNANERESKKLMSRLVTIVRKSYKKKKRSKDSPTLEQAKKRNDWPKFQAAIDAELEQLVQEGVYKELKYSDIDKGITPIGTMLVLQVKRTPDGKIDKYKARLVALGNQQPKDHSDTIKSPTARTSTVKMLLSIQAKTKTVSCVIDVKGAYLKARVDPHKEKLYIRLPDGRYGQLLKYLYGLKQAGYQWSETLSSVLISQGYQRSVYDPCLYYMRKGKEFIIMTTHVDDFYVIATKQHMIEDLHEELIQAFGEVTVKTDDMLGYLGMKVEKKGQEIFISQPGYLQKILERAEIPTHKTAETPYIVNMTSKSDDDESIDKSVYLEHIGMLNYLAVLTRPDILYALSRCAQRCSSPTKRDLRRVKKIFMYLNGTKDHGLTFSCNGDIQLVGWVDASHTHYEDGKGHFGYAFSFGVDDGVFYAKSQKMKIVTPAGSTDTEYVAMYEAATEIVFLRNLLNEIGFKQNGPTILYEDNKSTIDLANGLGKFHKQKHVNVKYHYTKDLVREGVIQVCYCHTEQMIADIFTKALSKAQHKYLVSLILNVTNNEHEDSDWTLVSRK